MSNTDIEARKGVIMLKGKKKSILYSLPVRKAADEQPQLRDKKPSTGQSQGKKCLKTDFVVSKQMLSQRA